MFGIGGFELFIILVFGFLIFGPDKLPEIAKTVGKGIARFREAQQEMNDALGGEKIFDPNNPDEPFKDPVEVLDRIAQRQEEKKAAKAGAGPATPQASGPTGAEGAAGEAGAADADAQPRQESFTERKARYERERAARKAAERQAVSQGRGTGGDGPAAAETTAPAEKPAAGEASATGADPEVAKPSAQGGSTGSDAAVEPSALEGGDA